MTHGGAAPVSYTVKRERFVAEFLVDLNAARAALRAGYARSGAKVTGCRLLKDPLIAGAIAKAQAEIQARTAITQDWVIGKLRDNAEKATKAEQFGAVNGALQLIGKHIGMFVDRHELSGPGGPLQVTVTHRIVDPSAG
jgi:phage terminase small subunit